MYTFHLKNEEKKRTKKNKIKQTAATIELNEQENVCDCNEKNVMKLIGSFSFLQNFQNITDLGVKT